MRRIGTALALMAAGFAAVPAAAQSLSSTIYEGNSLPLAIPVTATIGGRCQFATGGAPAGSYTIPGYIDTDAWTHDFDFTIECNTASRVAVVSLNGGLKTGATVTDPGYLGLAPYTVALALVGDSTDASASCDVAGLSASSGTPCSFRGPASAANGLRLTGPSVHQSGSKLTVSAPAYATTAAGAATTLVDGTYTDTLTITIAAAP